MYAFMRRVLLLSDFNKNQDLSKNFIKNPKHEIPQKFVQWEYSYLQLRSVTLIPIFFYLYHIFKAII